MGRLKIINKNIHWEVARDPPASVKYCTKDEGRLEPPFEFGAKPKVAVAKPAKLEVI